MCFYIEIKKEALVMKRFRKHGKRLISAFLVILLAASLIPAGTVFVNAATNFYYKYNPDYSTPQYANSFADAWNEAQTSSNGCVGILADTNLSSTVSLPAGKSITLELNGHKLNRGRITQSSSSDCNVITVGNGSALTVYGGTKANPAPTCTNSFVYYTYSGTTSTVSVTNKGLITGGCNTKNGGGIAVEENGTCNLYYTAVSGNRADDGTFTIGGYGGGIALRGDYAKLNMHNSEVSYNYAEVGGGVCAVDSDYAKITAEYSDITHNIATDNGGGAAVIDSDECKIKGDSDGLAGDPKSKISINTAYKNGGGLYINKDNAVIDGFDIGYNASYNDENGGGGIYLNKETCAVKNCYIYINSATTNGGGIYNNNDGNTLEDLTVTNNTAGGVGDGVYNYGTVDVALSGKCII